MNNKNDLYQNETLKTIFERYSCRSFTGKKPSSDELIAISDAAVAAPSAVNRQPWRVVVLTDADLIKEVESEGLERLKAMDDQSFYERIMSRGGTLFYNAPCIIFIAIDKGSGSYSQIDCGIITQNVALSAASLGLGSVICGLAGLAFENSEKAAYFKEKLGFPEGYDLGIAVLIGESANETEPHPLDRNKIIFI